MRYVARNATGQVTAHFANEQTFATECLPEDHPDIADYRRRVQAAIKPPAAVHVAGTVRRSPFARGLLHVLAQHLQISPDELLRQITAAVEPDSSTLDNDNLLNQ